MTFLLTFLLHLTLWTVYSFSTFHQMVDSSPLVDFRIRSKDRHDEG